MNRYFKHKHALKYEDSPEATALSRFVWSQRKAGKEDPKLEWSDDGRAPHYRSGSRVCGLCNLETYKIAICPESMRLNPHSELLKKVDIFVSYTFVSYTRFSKKLMK